MQFRLPALFILILLLPVFPKAETRCDAEPARHHSLPTPILPDGLGINIHFTDPQPGEMKMLAVASFRWIRMDFFWSRTEKRKGQDDFAAYDRLMSILDQYHIRPLFILAFDNPLYDSGQSPHTDEGRQAFANWAAAGVRHFQNRGVLWEMWNEPNNSEFWKPKPKVDDYIKLALGVGRQCEVNKPRAARQTSPLRDRCTQARLSSQSGRQHSRDTKNRRPQEN